MKKQELSKVAKRNEQRSCGGRLKSAEILRSLQQGRDDRSAEFGMTRNAVTRAGRPRPYGSGKKGDK